MVERPAVNRQVTGSSPVGGVHGPRQSRRGPCRLLVGPRRSAPFRRRGEGSALSALDREGSPPIETRRFGVNDARTLALSNSPFTGFRDRDPRSKRASIPARCSPGQSAARAHQSAAPRRITTRLADTVITHQDGRPNSLQNLTNMLRIQNLSVSYMLSTSADPLKVLDGVCVEVQKGGYCSIVGPSGCGKTTLLLCLAGLIQPTAGSVELGGHSPATVRDRHKIGLVFQKPVFFEWRSVLENVALAAELAGKRSPMQQASHYLSAFHLNGFASAFPHELSGGMLSRAALARALVHDPDYLLLDEAFNHLDEALRDTINLDIQTLWMNRKPTVVAVTHSISEAILMSDRILVLSRKPARILQAFDVPFDRPRHPSLRTDQRFTTLAEQIRTCLRVAYGESDDAIQ